MVEALQIWMRLARAAARSQTALVVLQRKPAGPAHPMLRPDLHDGGLLHRRTARARAARVMWDGAGGAPTLLDGLVARVDVSRSRGGGGEPATSILELATESAMAAASRACWCRVSPSRPCCASSRSCAALPLVLGVPERGRQLARRALLEVESPPRPIAPVHGPG